jgi:hypothetical protein
MAKVTIKFYASPTCVLLAFDWADGPEHPDFLGFAIQHDPGYGADKKPQFLFNKLDFVPLAKDAKPKPSSQAPFQKFNWWIAASRPPTAARSSPIKSYRCSVPGRTI